MLYLHVLLCIFDGTIAHLAQENTNRFYTLNSTLFKVLLLSGNFERNTVSM